MKLFKGGLVVAALSIAAMTFSTAAASADPIGAPFTASGTIALNGGLGGTACDITAGGSVNGNTITSAAFSNCRGVAGQPTALLGWAVAWNSRNTGGTITVSALSVVLGSSCLYTGSVPFTYSARVLSLATTTNIPKISGGVLCPSSVAVTGTLTVA